MSKKFVKLIIVFGLILLFSIDIFLFLKFRDFKKMKDYYYSTVSLNGMLKRDLISTFTNNDKEVSRTLISSDMNDSIIEIIPESLQLPALVIYLPYSEDVCISCISFAIDKIKSSFSDFEVNNQIIIITSKYNPNIKGRVFKKKIYHLIPANPQLGIPADNEKIPHYFIISKNRKIDYFFSPNSLFPDLTDKYIETIRTIIGNN